MKKIDRKQFIMLFAFAIFAGSSLLKKIGLGIKSAIIRGTEPSIYPGKVIEKGDFSKPGNELAG